MDITTTKERLEKEQARHAAAKVAGPGWVILDGAGTAQSAVYLEGRRSAAVAQARKTAKVMGRPMRVGRPPQMQYADLRTLGQVIDAYVEIERDAGEAPELPAFARKRGVRAELAPRTDHMAEDCEAIAARHDLTEPAAVAEICRRVQVILVLRKPALPAATYVHELPRQA